MNKETEKKEAKTSQIMCHVCLGAGQMIHRNYLFKEVGQSSCYYCQGTGMGLITESGELKPRTTSVN